MGEEALAGLVHGDPSGGHVFVDLALALLPPLGPEPCLVSRHWECRAEFEDAVGRSVISGCAPGSCRCRRWRRSAGRRSGRGAGRRRSRGSRRIPWAVRTCFSIFVAALL